MNQNDNLAYAYDLDVSSLQREEKIAKIRKESKAKARKKRIKLHRTIISCISIFALCAGFMISRNVSAYESKRNVEKLQKDLNELTEYASQKSFELDKSIDLDTVEEIAKDKLNMVRPEKYQMVYVNIKQDDVTEVTASEVEGIKSFFGIFGGKN